MRIEFSPDVADGILAEHAGTEVDYAIVIRPAPAGPAPLPRALSGRRPP